MSAVQGIVWAMWFLSCLTRVRWLICGVCVIGIIVNYFHIAKINRKKNNTSCWIAIVFFSVVIIGNIVFVVTR